MKERRQYERFSLALPTRMEPMISSSKQVFDFETRDISASGAFIYTKELFSEGTRFKLNLTVLSERIKEITGANGLIQSEGKIVRSTPTGVAIHFGKKCQILNLRGL